MVAEAVRGVLFARGFPPTLHRPSPSAVILSFLSFRYDPFSSCLGLNKDKATVNRLKMYNQRAKRDRKVRLCFALRSNEVFLIPLIGKRHLSVLSVKGHVTSSTH